jgi:hypothetical protein
MLARRHPLAGGDANLHAVGQPGDATIGRFLAAGDRLLAPARQLLLHRSGALALIAVFGVALGDP